MEGGREEGYFLPKRLSSPVGSSWRISGATGLSDDPCKTSIDAWIINRGQTCYVGEAPVGQHVLEKRKHPASTGRSKSTDATPRRPARRR